MHGLVRELVLQVYKTICNNVFKFGNLLHSTREVVEYFSYYALANNVIHRTDAVHV